MIVASVHNNMEGSEDGHALIEEWYKETDHYKGASESDKRKHLKDLAAKWRSMTRKESSDGYIAVGSLIKYAAQRYQKHVTELLQEAESIEELDIAMAIPRLALICQRR